LIQKRLGGRYAHPSFFYAFPNESLHFVFAIFLMPSRQRDRQLAIVPLLGDSEHFPCSIGYDSGGNFAP
jgi:hypothetical protein